MKEIADFSKLTALREKKLQKEKRLMENQRSQIVVTDILRNLQHEYVSKEKKISHV